MVNHMAESDGRRIPKTVEVLFVGRGKRLPVEANNEYVAEKAVFK